jgi:hypothetical protein
MGKNETTVKVLLLGYPKASMLSKFTPVNSVVVTGARGSVLFKALCYRPEGRGFETR